jgi:DNA topoisomerase-1
MQVAQKLYEGINLRGKGTTGLITYMRTDSVRVEPEAIVEVRAHIEKVYGAAYLPAKTVEYKDKKAGNVQDAHEAIRPTHLEDTPDKVRADMSADEYALYNLIYQKFVASQMNNAILEETVVMLECEGSYFRTSGTITKFDGFKKAFSDATEEKKVKKGEEDESADAVLPVLSKDEKLTPIEPPKVSEKRTSPPPRFTEATLVKELEERGIGRPSTYSAIISNITSKTYVEKEKGRFKPTDLGDQVCRALVTHFPREMDVDFTANVENSLDQIEDGTLNWLTFVKDFWKNFEQSLNKAMLEMKKVRNDKVENSTGIKCVKCQDGEYVVRKGKNGDFLACSNYPACTSTQQFEKSATGEIKIVDKPKYQLALVDKKCPKCGSQMALKKNKEGGEFYACSNYPICRCTVSIDTTGIICPKCHQGEIIARVSKNKNKFWSCSNYQECNNVYWNESDLANIKKPEETEA